MKTATRKKEWFDDDSFWRELYPFMFSKERIADADEQVAKALALTKPTGKSVLDLCCGPGRCSIALAKGGFSVTGVDRTKYLLDKARAKASAVGHQAGETNLVALALIANAICGGHFAIGKHEFATGRRVGPGFFSSLPTWKPGVVPLPVP